jgi:hypothetical protein
MENRQFREEDKEEELRSIQLLKIIVNRDSISCYQDTHSDASVATSCHQLLAIA